MLIEYEDEAIRDLVTRGESSDKRYRKFASNARFKKDLRKAVFALRSVENTKDLRVFSYLEYEQLKYDYSGSSSVRIGKAYRLIFTEFDNGIRIKLIEVNKHYGDK